MTGSPTEIPVTPAPTSTDRSRAFVAEDHRRIIPKRVVQDVQVGSAYAAERDLHLDQSGTARRFLDVAHVDVAGPGRVLDDRFHAAACLGCVPTRAFERKKNSTSSVITKDIAAELSQNDCQLRTTPVAVVVEK